MINDVTIDVFSIKPKRNVYYTWISCAENTFDTRINVLIDEMQTYEWTNVTWISHLPMNSCIKCVFNAWYKCMKHTNYEWTRFAQFPLLSCEMLSLWSSALTILDDGMAPWFNCQVACKLAMCNDGVGKLFLVKNITYL
jgi:hypothetical protein